MSIYISLHLYYYYYYSRLADVFPGLPGFAVTRMLINPDLHFTLSIASCLLRPTSFISFSTTSFQVFFGLPLPTCPVIFSSVHFLIHSPSYLNMTEPPQPSFP